MISVWPDFATFMAGWGWVIFSLISAAFVAGIYLNNQYLKQPGHMVVFWSRIATVLAMTPIVLHLDWPRDPLFYIAVFLTAVFGASADIRTLNVSARYGGGVVSRVQPLIILFSFLLWFFFDPSLLSGYATHPWRTAGILGALAGCIYFSSRLSKCPISRKAFIEMLPALIGYTITTVLNKYAMLHGPLAGAVFGYMYFQSAVAVLLVGGYVLWHEGKTKITIVPWRTKKMAAAALFMMLGWILSMIFKNYAMSFTPNPAYQAALAQTTPVFIMLFYALVKHKEEADVASGMGVVACTALLAMMTVG